MRQRRVKAVLFDAVAQRLAGINRRRQPVMGLITLTALVLRGQSYTLAHVGDSRAYLLRGGTTVQLTSDHVVLHPDFKHQLLRSVGAEDHLMVDYLQGDLHVGDVFVLVTDGVHGALRASVFEFPPVDFWLSAIGLNKARTSAMTRRCLFRLSSR